MIARRAKGGGPFFIDLALAEDASTRIIRGLTCFLGSVSQSEGPGDAHLSQISSRKPRQFRFRALLRIDRCQPGAGHAGLCGRWRGRGRRWRRRRGRWSWRRGLWRWCGRRSWRRRRRGRRWRRRRRRRRRRIGWGVLSPRPNRAPGAGPVGPDDLFPRPGLGYKTQEVPRQAQRRASRP